MCIALAPESRKVFSAFSDHDGYQSLWMILSGKTFRAEWKIRLDSWLTIATLMLTIHFIISCHFHNPWFMFLSVFSLLVTPCTMGRKLLGWIFRIACTGMSVEVSQARFKCPCWKDEALETSTLKWTEPDARDKSISCVTVAATHTVFSSRKEMAERFLDSSPWIPTQ